MTNQSSRRTAFIGGKVWTAGYSAPRALDVLVEGGRIARVAPTGQLELNDAEIHDISGKLLMPGFQDAHIHMGAGGDDLLTCNLAGLKTAEEVYAVIAAYSDENPDLPWVTGGGWDRRVFPYPEGPNRRKLDELVGGRPAFFSSFDRHGAWVSTAALKASAVDEDTADPERGFFRRDKDGFPTGMVEEESITAIRAGMPELSTQDRMDAILRAQDHVIRMGITSVQDALVGDGLGMPDLHEAYRELLKNGGLKLRLTTALWWDQRRGVEQIPELLERRKQLESVAGPHRIIADTVKMMVDGADLLFMDSAAIQEATVALDADGFSVHYHSYGDATTHWILDAVEEAIKKNGTKPRHHHIAHLFVVSEADFRRFAQLGVTANVQGFWLGTPVLHDHLHESTSVDHPEDLEYPFGRIHAAGGNLAAGSDWPVTTPDPLVCIRNASGYFIDPEGRTKLAEDDRLDSITMMTAYTTGSAFVNGRADSTGRIAVGFLADLVILDGGVFDSNDALRDSVVQEVWIGGQLEYRSHRPADEASDHDVDRAMRSASNPAAQVTGP
ncbi:amidohydrolase [Arthrobacter sp. S2(2024)]|uniref:amidohydrolase n=1 Tax=Arthrobacter sp. S2(2024) TaxID=3111911 RepID=UPI002FCC3114